MSLHIFINCFSVICLKSVSQRDTAVSSQKRSKSVLDTDNPYRVACLLRSLQRQLCQWMLHVSMYAPYKDSCVNGCSMCQCTLPTNTVVSMYAPCVNVCSQQRQLCQCMLHVSMYAPYKDSCVNVCSMHRSLCQCMLHTHTTVSMYAPYKDSCVNVCSMCQRQLKFCQCMLHVSMYAPYRQSCQCMLHA